VPFRDLGIDEVICTALDDAGHLYHLSIQALTLPLAIDGQDIIGQARTGTGKTLAFGDSRAAPGWRPRSPAARAARQPACLVVVPTRELAIQVADDLKRAGADSARACFTVYGGGPTSRRSRR